jgi:hypothetical protein
MRRFLLTTAIVAALVTPAAATTIGNLGVNPTSAQGNFQNAPGAGAFEDQFTFQLVGGPQFLTIASVTNTFASLSDFIANFQAAVWTTGANGIVNDGDDVPVIGPVAAGACAVPNCQGMSGSAILNTGNYYIELTGIAGSTAGYAGNLSVAAVPGPLAGAGLPGIIVGCLGLWAFAKRRRARRMA